MPLSIPDTTPPTEVPERARRRTFTADYKRRIVQEAENASKPGDVSALLRREGLYSSHIAEWRKARNRGDLAGAAKARGPVPKPAPDARDRRIAELERENVKLDKRARRAEAMVTLQKKLAQLLETFSNDDPSEKG